MKLSVVLPCYNEQESIQNVLDDLFNNSLKIKEQTNINEIEVICVNDGSTDNTKTILDNYNSKILTIHHPKNLGYGMALKNGFKKSTGDLITFYDVDNTCLSIELIKMINQLKNQGGGLVCGNRLHQNSKMPIVRTFGNWIYKSLASVILKTQISDLCSGMRVFESQFKENFYNLPDQLNFSLSMTMRFIKNKMGPYSEVPINYLERSGKSKLIPMTDGPLFLKTLFTEAFKKIQHT